MGWIVRCVSFAFVLIGGLFALPVHGQDARFYVPADSVSVGDRFHVAMVIDRPASTVAIFPDPARGDTTLGDLEILGMQRTTTPLPAESEHVRDSVTYEVTTFVLDSAVVSPQQALLVGGGDTVAVASRRLVIPVRSLVPADAEGVRDLAPIVPFERPIWPWVLGASAILAALLGFYLYRRRRRPADQEAVPRAPAASPYEEAVQRLVRLREFDLNQETDVKPFYVELSDIVRTYIERRAGFPALESTTRELVRHLEQAQLRGFPSTALARVRLVLERADLVKFADRRPSIRESEDAVSESRELVEEIERATRAAEEPAIPARAAEQA